MKPLEPGETMAIALHACSARSRRWLPLLVLVGACGSESAPPTAEGTPPPTRQTPVVAVVTSEDGFAAAPTVPAPPPPGL